MALHTTVSSVAPAAKAPIRAKVPAAPPSQQAQSTGAQDPLAQAQNIVAGEQTDMGKLTSQLNALQAKMPALQPPPQEHLVDPIKSFGSAATMIAVLGSLLTRAPLTSALNSAAAAMNSVQQKNLLDYQAQYNNWKQNTDFAVRQSQMLEQQYQDILGTAKLTNEQKTAQASMLATISQDYAMQAHLRTSDLLAAEKLSIARTKATSDMQLNAARIEQVHETLMSDPQTYATSLGVDDFVQQNGRQPTAQEFMGIAAHVNDVLEGNTPAPDSPALKQAQALATQIENLQKTPQTINGVKYTPADLKVVQSAGPDATNLTQAQTQLKALLQKTANTNALTAAADPNAPPSTVKTFSGYSQADMQAFVKTAATSGWTYKPTFGGTPAQQKLAQQQFTQAAATYMQQHPDGSSLTKEGLDSLYQLYFSSGGTEKPSFTFGPAGNPDRHAFINGMAAYAKAHNLDIAKLPEIKSIIAAAGGALHTLQVQSAVTNAAEKQILQNQAVALKWVGKTGMTNLSPYLNKWLTSGETFAGNPNVPPYVASVITVANEYARIMSGSTGAAGVSEHAMAEAAKLLSSATTPQALQNVFSVINTEAQNKAVSFALAEKAVTDTQGSAENAASTDLGTPNPFDLAPGSDAEDSSASSADPTATYNYNADGSPQ
jgi:uncharacterized coiled-coil protein SlyX